MSQSREEQAISTVPEAHMKLAAEVLKQEHSRLLNLWVDEVLGQVPSAHNKGRAELADHFTTLLDSLIDSLETTALDALEKLPLPNVSGGASAMHGRERTSLEGYTVGQLAQEFIIFRRLIVNELRRKGFDNFYVLEVVSRIAEQASLTSESAFAEAIHEIQQKLIGTLVHDVRTPIGVARTYAEVLAAAEVSADRKRQATSAIIRSLDRAKAMLEELLDTTRASAGQGLFMRFYNADLNDAINTICTEASQIYSAKIACSLEDHPVMGIFDIGLITRTVENLISNAVKFGDNRAPITISVKDKGNEASICVHNSGEPIPKADIDRIFHFLYSSSGVRYNPQKGWGMGLSLIKSVAKAHGGDVIAESDKETGTSFGMVLCKHYRQDGDAISVTF